MTFESQYRFANISATKARIFIKFQTYIHKIVTNDQKIFRKDQCTHAHTRGVNVCEGVLSRRNALAQIFALCAPVCGRILTKNQQIILYYLMNISLKFYKDPSFHCGDICKMVLTFKSHQFSMYFPYFHSNTPQKSQRWKITEWSWNFFGNQFSKCTYALVKKTPVSVYRLLSSPSNKRIVFSGSRGSPCITIYQRHLCGLILK